MFFTEKRDSGGNYDIFDGPEDSDGPPWFALRPGDILDQSGHYLYANVTFGGWLPNSYFEYLEFGTDIGTPSNYLAVAWTGRIIRSARSKPRWVADIFFNDGRTWNTDGTNFDIETVMLHELGHAIGLGHEDVISPAVMDSFYGGVQRDLWQDDIDGLLSIYPPGGPGNSDNGNPPWADALGGLNGLSFVSVQDYDAFSSASVPEPATLLLLVPSLVILLGRFRKQR